MRHPFHPIFLLAVAAFLSSGCLVVPRNGQDINDNLTENTVIKFEGYFQNPADQAILEVFNKRENQWVPLPDAGGVMSTGIGVQQDVDGDPLPEVDKQNNIWFKWSGETLFRYLQRYAQFDTATHREFYEVRATSKSSNSPLVSFDVDTETNTCITNNLPLGFMAIIQNCKSDQQGKVRLIGHTCNQANARACAGDTAWHCGNGLVPSIQFRDPPLGDFFSQIEAAGGSLEGSHFLFRSPAVCRNACGGSGQACCSRGMSAAAYPLLPTGGSCTDGFYCNENFTCGDKLEEMSAIDIRCSWKNVNVRASVEGNFVMVRYVLSADCPADASGTMNTREFEATLKTPKPPTTPSDYNQESNTTFNENRDATSL